MTITLTLRVLKSSFLRGCKIYKILLSLRLTFMWFPNFNAYQQPLYFLAQITDPYFDFFSKIFPPVFGFDHSFALSISFLELFLKTVTSINYY
jgi:uncharacterized protein YggT (Ycf19 family)